VKTFVVLSILLCIVAPALAETDREQSPPAPSREGAATEVPTGQLRLIGTVHVGEHAPDFTAASTSGRELTLSRMKGDWLVLVFAESREEFTGLRDLQNRLFEVGPRVLGICKDKPQRLRAYAESEELPFELLSDVTGEISALYGYYDWQSRATTRGFVVLDRFGVVRLALQGQAPADQVADLARFTIAGY
jgi:peroxiredoxin Q/BCP